MKKITSQELAAKMGKESVFILDIRPKSSFDPWHIDGKNIHILHLEAQNILDNDPKTLSQLSKEDEIIVVCARGISAQKVGGFLEEKGYHVTYLEGGMTSWGQFYDPVPVRGLKTLKLFQFQRLAKGCLSYMVLGSKEALVVDPGRNLKPYLDLSHKHGVKISKVIDTHLHADHLSGANALAVKTGATYYMSQNEKNQMKHPVEGLQAGQKLSLGEQTVEILALNTPGHTAGSISVLIDHTHLLSGDTVFVTGLGRPDLGGKTREWAKMLHETVYSTLKKLPDDTWILPAHYADIREMNEEGIVSRTWGEITKTNQLLNMPNQETFVQEIAKREGVIPDHYRTIIKVNKGEVQVDEEEADQLEVGANQCAVTK